MFARNLVLLGLLLFAFTGVTQAANVTVGANGSMAFSPSTVTINAGDSVTFTYSGGGLPHNVVSDTGLFRCAKGCDGAGGNGNATNNGWTSTVTFNTAGTFGYYCEIHGGPGGSGMSGTVTVNGAAPTPDFSIAPDAGSLSLTQGGAAASTGISVTAQNGFTGNVTFAASGLPDGVTAAFNPNGASNTTLSLSASSTAATGNSTVTITATSGSLTHTTSVALTVNASAPTFAITAGITGSWYNPTQSGQGFNVEVMPNNLVVAFWYVFDNAGNNLWLSGIGNYVGDTAILNMTATTGGMFPPNFDPTKIARAPWGTLTFNFTDCSNGTATWAPVDTATFPNGSLAIKRLTGVNGLACP